MPQQPALQPKNELARLKQMARTRGAHDVHWQRAIGPTSQLLGVRATDAERYVLETIQQLEARDFVESKDQGGIWFDVYARYRDGRGWFVKIGEDDDGLIVMSHHDPERGAVRTSAGIVIEVIEPAGNAEENHENA